MIPFTDEDKESYSNKKNWQICKKEFDNDDD